MEELESAHPVCDFQLELKAYSEENDQLSPESYVRAGGQNQLKFYDFIERITKVLLPDFLASEDVREAVESLKDLNCFSYHDAFVVKGIRMALDYPVTKQRWMSEFLTILYDAKLVTRAQLNRAFEKLVHQGHDIQLDVPDAYLKLYTFLRCAIEDGIISSSFELRLPESFLVDLIGELQRDSYRSDEEIERVNSLLKNLQDYKKQVTEFTAKSALSLDQIKKFLSTYGQEKKHHELVQGLIVTSMARQNVHRECVSSCLSGSLGTGDCCLNRTSLVVGFLRLLEMVEELKKKDLPDVETLLTKFILRALSDEILSQTFVLDCIRLNFGGSEARCVVKSVKERLLKSFDGSLVPLHFQKIWLAEDPDSQEMREFKKQVRNVLHDHFDDLNFSATKEALDQIEMTAEQIPFFVKKALDLTIEKTEKEQKDILDLFEYLRNTKYVDLFSLTEGFRMCQQNLPELSVDVPKAPEIFHCLTRDAQTKKLLLENFF